MVFAELAGTTPLEPAVLGETRGRSLSPKGSASAIMLPRVTEPPRGMMASPKIVTMREPPRSGRCRRKRARSPAAALFLVIVGIVI
jgi:hypothetical protein